MTAVLAGSFVLGIVAGMRTFLAPTALYLARGGIAGYILALAAAGELVVDILPQTPSRTILPAVIGRVVSGAFVGWMLCSFLGAQPIAGAALGIAGALLGTYGGAHVRGLLIQRFGAVPAALIEDAFAIALAVATVSALPAIRLA